MEMMAGRMAVRNQKGYDENENRKPMWAWADEGAKYLREHFKREDIQFHTTVEKGRVHLEVWRHGKDAGDVFADMIFEIRERAEYFPSELLVAKVAMVI